MVHSLYQMSFKSLQLLKSVLKGHGSHCSNKYLTPITNSCNSPMGKSTWVFSIIPLLVKNGYDFKAHIPMLPEKVLKLYHQFESYKHIFHAQISFCLIFSSHT